MTQSDNLVLISYFKPKPLPGADSVSIFAEMRFDKILARCSLAVDASANALIVLFPTSSQVSFILFSCLSSFTSGGNPSVHSLGAVCLHASGNSSEVGTLFGAMAVLSALAHIVSVSRSALSMESRRGSHSLTMKSSHRSMPSHTAPQSQITRRLSSVLLLGCSERLFCYWVP